MSALHHEARAVLQMGGVTALSANSSSNVLSIHLPVRFVDGPMRLRRSADSALLHLSAADRNVLDLGSVRLTHRSGARRLEISGPVKLPRRNASRCAPSPDAAVDLSKRASWVILGARADSRVALVKPHSRAELYIIGSLFETANNGLRQLTCTLAPPSPPRPLPSPPSAMPTSDQCNLAAFKTNSDYACMGTTMCKRKHTFQGFFVGVTVCSSGSNHYKVCIRA